MMYLSINSLFTQLVPNVSAATEEQAAMMDEISTSSRSMAELAQQLQQEVVKFKL